MAYTIPDVGLFKARFPEFASLGDPLLTLLLMEADNYTDARWNEKDRTIAVLHLAAHAAQQALIAQKLFIAETETTGSTDPFTDESLYISAVRFSDREVSFNRKVRSTTTTTQSSQQMGLPYNQTPYGQEFLRLRRRNIGGPIVLADDPPPRLPPPVII